MDKKKMIIVALIVVVLAVCAILIANQNNTDGSDLTNNTTKNNISNDTIENNSVSKQAIVGEKTVSSNNNPENKENHIPRSWYCGCGPVVIDANALIESENAIKNVSNNVVFENSSSTNIKNEFLMKITAGDIKKYVGENNLWRDYGKDIVVGEPYLYATYWSHRVWLVPAFDNNTGEFIHAVYVRDSYIKSYIGGTIGISYTGKIDTYSDYLNALANKPVRPKYVDIPFIGGLNKTVPDMSNSLNSSSVYGNDVVLDNIIFYDTGANADLRDDNIELNNSQNLTVNKEVMG